MSDVAVVEERKENRGGFRFGAGRKPGALNKIPHDLKLAMFDGALNSKHAKDPNNTDAPGTLTQFMTTIANERAHGALGPTRASSYFPAQN